MDRLLTEQEATDASLQDKENGLDIITIYLKAQDTKTASLVAQEIIQDYENAFEPTVPMSITYEKHHAIKSKWGVEC